MGTTNHPKQTLTHSRSESFKKCRRRHHFEYELGLRPTVDAKALRMGSMYHDGLDLIKRGHAIEDVVLSIRSRYDGVAELDVDTKAYECETLCALLSGYQWRWPLNSVLVLRSEKAFAVPLRNPETNAAAKGWELRGKIDGIVRLEDGRVAVIEHKLLSEDLARESDWWRRLQIDPQVSIYVHAARKLGYSIQTVLYDVTRKPTIRPEAVPLLDEHGFKIVLDSNGTRVMTKDGKKPRETGSSTDGYVLQTRPMTPEEWGQKLIADIGERPDWYYARVEIPRLDDEVAETLAELWDIAKVIREAQLNNRWYRTVSFSTCPYCSYFGICSSKMQVDPAYPPDGFQVLTDKFPELTMEETT